jgi:predicted nucleic acid-binding protein
MIILDTNVLSAMMQIEFNPVIQAWLDRQNEADLYTTAITVYELQFGIQQLAEGRRKQALAMLFSLVVEQNFHNRILSFDIRASFEAASIAAARMRNGTMQGLPDTLIAGIAQSSGATIATRNVRHFAGLTVPVIDPWAA